MKYAIGVLYRVCSILLLVALATPASHADELPEPPELARELRGVWVATVENIDWPSARDLSVSQQQAEARAILDLAAELRLNTVVFQVRPAADALYPSDLEPWSYYLTGEQGKAPEPFYDPLAFWIRESHARGLELHVWLNPFRVQPNKGSYELSPDSIFNTDPELVVDYGNDTKRMLWMNPAMAAARERTLAVFEDLVTRYDLDGVHIDDYFYPYPVDGVDWPTHAYDAYVADGGELSLGDFRRKAIDDLVEAMYEQTKEIKPHVKVGISPFGIWRPGNPPSIQGFDQYARLYADARKWLQEGWLDYWTPQLYWPIARVPQSFPQLLVWWHQQNDEDRILAPGLYTGRVKFQDWPVDEIIGQVLTARAISSLTETGTGHVHFSSQILTQNIKGMSEQYRDRIYTEVALPPEMPWIDDDAPDAPDISLAADTATRATRPTTQPASDLGDKFETVQFLPSPEPDAGLRLTLRPDGEIPRRWAVQVLRESTGWTTTIHPGTRRTLVIADFDDDAVEAVAVRAIDAAGNASEAAVVLQSRSELAEAD
ncbi:MAG: family 10 glycosylhydrolase [Planctomycetota bacterium]